MYAIDFVRMCAAGCAWFISDHDPNNDPTHESRMSQMSALRSFCMVDGFYERMCAARRACFISDHTLIQNFRISQKAALQSCCGIIYAQLGVCISFRVTASYRFSEFLKRQLCSHVVRHWFCENVCSWVRLLHFGQRPHTEFRVFASYYWEPRQSLPFGSLSVSLCVCVFLFLFLSSLSVFLTLSVCLSFFLTRSL